MRDSRFEHARLKWVSNFRRHWREGGARSRYFHYGRCQRANLCAGDEAAQPISAETLSRRRTPVRRQAGLSGSSEQWLQRAQRKEARDRLATLTPREFDVLKGVMPACSTNKLLRNSAQPRDDQGPSRRVIEKMGARSVAELVILAQKAGIDDASTDATKV